MRCGVVHVNEGVACGGLVECVTKGRPEHVGMHWGTCRRGGARIECIHEGIEEASHVLGERN